ncbi:MAG TPA: hypothetical protein VMF70_05775 [Gemmatimonadales bacterium]|nr:hypothetical protein [Gemmatimonadales bacterium]
MIIPSNVPSQLPSPRVQELGQKLALAISEFRQRYPDVSEDEVRQAARLATNVVATPRRVATGLTAALVAALVAGGGLVWLDSASSGGGHLGVDLAAGAVALLAVIAVVRSRAQG